MNPNDPEVTDEALMARVQARDEAAFRVLHLRYARLVFGIAARSLGTEGAQEVAQDVLLTIWQKAQTYDSKRGAFRPWILQIAHHRIVNALRAERRRGAATSSADAEDLPDPSPEADDEVWRAHRTKALRTALDTLPPDQRHALSLAFLEELTNEQVASFLALPVGTAKSRIRLALRRLRPLLAAMGVVSALAIGAFFVRRELRRTSLERDALRMVTMSDVETLRLSAAPGVPPDRHGNYRARPGEGLAVLTVSNLPPAAPGAIWTAWARVQGTWTRLGVVRPGSDGRALVVTSSDLLVQRPEIVEVTLETTEGATTPSGEITIVWTK